MINFRTGIRTTIVALSGVLATQASAQPLAPHEILHGEEICDVAPFDPADRDFLIRMRTQVAPKLLAQANVVAGQLRQAHFRIRQGGEPGEILSGLRQDFGPLCELAPGLCSADGALSPFRRVGSSAPRLDPNSLNCIPGVGGCGAGPNATRGMASPDSMMDAARREMRWVLSEPLPYPERWEIETRIINRLQSLGGAPAPRALLGLAAEHGILVELSAELTEFGTAFDSHLLAQSCVRDLRNSYDPLTDHIVLEGEPVNLSNVPGRSRGELEANGLKQRLDAAISALAMWVPSSGSYTPVVFGDPQDNANTFGQFLTPAIEIASVASDVAHRTRLLNDAVLAADDFYYETQRVPPQVFIHGQGSMSIFEATWRQSRLSRTRAQAQRVRDQGQFHANTVEDVLMLWSTGLTQFEDRDVQTASNIGCSRNSAFLQFLSDDGKLQPFLAENPDWARESVHWLTRWFFSCSMLWLHELGGDLHSVGFTTDHLRADLGDPTPSIGSPVSPAELLDELTGIQVDSFREVDRLKFRMLMLEYLSQ